MEKTNLKYLIERKNFYSIGDLVLIEYWYNHMICVVKIIDKIGNRFKISYNNEKSKIKNAPDEVIKSSRIISIYR